MSSLGRILLEKLNVCLLLNAVNKLPYFVSDSVILLVFCRINALFVVRY